MEFQKHKRADSSFFSLVIHSSEEKSLSTADGAQLIDLFVIGERKIEVSIPK